jgi:ankyrin repeat protein
VTADIDDLDAMVNSAYLLTAESGHGGVMVLLLDHDAIFDELVVPFGDTLLRLSADAGFTDVAKQLLDCGVDARIKNGSLKTALHAAAINGPLHIVALLIARGASMDAVDKLQHTAFQLAEEAGHQDLVRLMQDQFAASFKSR